MSESFAAARTAPRPEERTTGQVLRVLIGREWLTHGRLIGWLLSIAGIGLFIFPFVNHPGWVLAYCTLASAVLGQALGASEVMEGSEEFAFSLPALRREYYIAKCALGLATVLFLAALGVTTLRMDLTNTLWGMFAESGFTGWRVPDAPAVVWRLCFLLPVALFSLTLATACLCRSPRLAAFAWLPGGLTAGGLVLIGFLMENLRTKELHASEPPTGMFVLPALVIASIAALAGGMLLHSRKTVSGAPEVGSRTNALTTALVVGAIILLLLFVFLTLGTARSS